MIMPGDNRRVIKWMRTAKIQIQFLIRAAGCQEVIVAITVNIAQSLAGIPKTLTGIVSLVSINEGHIIRRKARSNDKRNETDNRTDSER